MTEEKKEGEVFSKEFYDEAGTRLHEDFMYACGKAELRERIAAAKELLKAIWTDVVQVEKGMDGLTIELRSFEAVRDPKELSGQLEAIGAFIGSQLEIVEDLFKEGKEADQLKESLGNLTDSIEAIQNSVKSAPVARAVTEEMITAARENTGATNI